MVVQIIKIEQPICGHLDTPDFGWCTTVTVFTSITTLKLSTDQSESVKW